MTPETNSLGRIQRTPKVLSNRLTRRSTIEAASPTQTNRNQNTSMSTDFPSEEVASRPTSKLASLYPLIGAAAFMVTGILILIYIGRDTASLMNAPLGDVDIYPLAMTETNPTSINSGVKQLSCIFGEHGAAHVSKNTPSFLNSQRSMRAARTWYSSVSVAQAGPNPTWLDSKRKH